LLYPEEVEVLDNSYKQKSKNITRYDIERGVTDILEKGMTTSFAGGFFFIPYLLQLQAHDLIGELGPPKNKGIHNERLGLGLVFESIFGLTEGIRAIDSISRTDFGLLAGLPFLPSTSTQYRFLQDISYDSALSFQIDLGKWLRTLGQVNVDSPVNIDGHNIKSYSRKAMKKSYITKEGSYGKAIRTFYTQDQEGKKPLIAMATYSGTNISQVTGRISRYTQNILDSDFLLVADKEWYCGELIKDLQTRYNISILTPAKHFKSKVTEFEEIPSDKYEETIQGDIASVYTTMKGFDGPLQMFVKKRPDGKYFALITPKEDLNKDIAMSIYSKRWRIENFFAKNDFLGINKLPSMNLNAIQAMLSLRILAFHAVDNFRHDLGGNYKTNTPNLIYRKFIDGVQGKIQMHEDVIEVQIYGFKHESAVKPIFSNLNEKLKMAGVDPRIPWLGNRRIRFKFR